MFDPVSCHGQEYAEDTTVWERRTPELVALLADSTPQLHSLGHWYPSDAPANPASALPTDVRRLSQLSSLNLNLSGFAVTTAQVDAVVQGLPALQRLTLYGRGSGWNQQPGTCRWVPG